MSVTTIPITAEQLWNMPENNQRCELVEGELRMMAPASGGHGRMAARILVLLYNHVNSHRLGEVFAAETGFIVSRNPDTVRAPDVAFISAGRIPPEGIPSQGFVPVVPDLAIEVLSPGDSQMEVEEKIEQWLAAGVKAVWVVNPKLQTLTAHASGQDPRVLRQGDTLDASGTVPGFTLKIRQVFE